jgi:hypothetical protein
VFEFDQVIERPTVFSGVGKLVRMKIKAVGAPTVVTLGFDGKTLLAQDKKARPGKHQQLYIVGGDQAVNLGDFGIAKPHASEILGAIKAIVYHTEKTHLEDGGKANYDHKFRTKRVGEKHVQIKAGRWPMAVYDVVNKQISIAGGTYDLPDVGIRG